MLVCAAAQIAPGTALLAGALALGLHVADHSHSISLVPSEGHVDLVLSHDERSDRAGEVDHDAPEANASERDHVVHLTSNDAANTAPRRLGAPAAPALLLPAAVSPAPPAAWIPRPVLELRARSADSPRTVVLRL